MGLECWNIYKIFSDILKFRNKKYHITTVNLSKNAIHVCKKMTEENNNNISYIIDNSENFLNNCESESIDLYI